jgi:predicted nuclease of predicted toxin-antitoxin system
VYAVTGRFLKGLKHDVLTVADTNLSRAPDIKLLKISIEQKRIFITRDRDFGGLVFVEELGAGILYLRVLPSTINSVHKELESILSSYSEDDLQSALPDLHNIASTTSSGLSLSSNSAQLMSLILM